MAEDRAYRRIFAGDAMTARQIAEELGGTSRSGGGWMARCPAHEDRTASLSIADGAGRLLVHCFAGCSQASVIATLRERGLWVNPAHTEQRLGPCVEEYIYTDLQGEPQLRVTRHEPKTFRQWHPDGRGGWLPGSRGVQPIPYRATEVAQAPIVFIVEGERDVETLRRHGFCATTNAGGAGKWRREHSLYLKGKIVILCGDTDPPGREHMRQVASRLGSYPAKIMELNLEEDGVKDVTQWFERGHSEVELVETLELIWQGWEAIDGQGTTR